MKTTTSCCEHEGTEVEQVRLHKAFTHLVQDVVNSKSLFEWKNLVFRDKRIVSD